MELSEIKVDRVYIRFRAKGGARLRATFTSSSRNELAYQRTSWTG